MAARNPGGARPSPKAKRTKKTDQKKELLTYGKSTETGEMFGFFFGKDSPFSQWHPVEFEVEGVKYNCAEKYMMHQKAVLFKDDVMAANILKSDSPKEQKAFGRKVSNFDPEIWSRESMKIVKAGNMAKFGQNDHLRQALFETKGATLVEASPRDTLWGIGLGAANPKARERKTWRGKNKLGIILTEVREELMKSKKETVKDDEDTTTEKDKRTSQQTSVVDDQHDGE